MRPLFLTLLALTFSTQSPAPARARQGASRPAFTLVSRVTVTPPDGTRKVSEVTRYVSSNGSVRAITKEADGTVSGDYLYESGRGAFYVRHEKKELVKSYSTPPEASDEPPPTAEKLRADPNFAGTEELLGYTAYIIRQTHPGRGVRDRDYYYAPEFGRTPLKEVRYSGGEVFVVTEPVSVKFGEPEAALTKAPAGYAWRPATPVSGGVLNSKLIERVAPVWPQEAREVMGTVVVMVLVDEEGKVVEAEAVSGPTLLRQAAVEAARKARFAPTKLSGQPVRVTGTLSYNFKR